MNSVLTANTLAVRSFAASKGILAFISLFITPQADNNPRPAKNVYTAISETILKILLHFWISLHSLIFPKKRTKYITMRNIVFLRLKIPKDPPIEFRKTSKNILKVCNIPYKSNPTETIEIRLIFELCLLNQFLL